MRFPLSEFSGRRTLSTTALTPEDSPVILVPTNCSAYAATGTPR